MGTPKVLLILWALTGSDPTCVAGLEEKCLSEPPEFTTFEQCIEASDIMTVEVSNKFEATTLAMCISDPRTGGDNDI